MTVKLGESSKTAGASRKPITPPPARRIAAAPAARSIDPAEHMTCGGNKTPPIRGVASPPVKRWLWFQLGFYNAGISFSPSLALSAARLYITRPLKTKDIYYIETSERVKDIHSIVSAQYVLVRPPAVH